MNNRHIILSLNDIANELEDYGFFVEASALTSVMKRMAQSDTANQNAYQAKIFQQEQDFENNLYTTSINQIANLLNTKKPENRDQANKIYEDTILQFKNPKRKMLFNKQFQQIVSRNFKNISNLPTPYNANSVLSPIQPKMQ